MTFYDIRRTVENSIRGTHLYKENENMSTQAGDKSTIPSRIISIDRSQPVNLTTFNIPVGCKLTTHDSRVLRVVKFDLSKLKLKSYLLSSDEHNILATEKLTRIRRAGDIPLDIKIAEAFWCESGHVSLNWIKDYLGMERLDFLATRIISPEDPGLYSILCFEWLVNKWRINYSVGVNTPRMHDPDPSVVICGM